MSTLFGWLTFFPSEAAYSVTRYGQIGRVRRDEPLEAAIKCRYSGSKNSRRAYVVYPRVWILEMSTLFGWLTFFPSEAAYSVTSYGQIGRLRATNR